MNRIAVWLLATCLGWVAVAQATPSITASEIVEKNAVARGGVEAWRQLQTMAWTGHVESYSAPGRKLPFLLEQKRPNQTRFEILAEGQKGLRIFDGSNGWKLRPNGSGMPDKQRYTDDESRFARGAQAIDGPLMGYAAKGGAIALGGLGEVEGRKAYVLDVKLPSGGKHLVWVDTETFLELRHDREIRSAAGTFGTVTVFYRDYHAFEGLQIPLVVETRAQAPGASNKLVIEKVAINPQLDSAMFGEPAVPVSRRKGITVDARGLAATSPSRPVQQP